MTLVVVAIGGALGAVARYGASTWVGGMAGPGFPWGTLTVNTVGSLLLGFFAVWLHANASSEMTRHLITVGFLGSFTTFSTFSQETLDLLSDGAVSRAVLYALGSVMIGLAAAALGAWTAGSLVGGQA